MGSELESLSGSQYEKFQKAGYAWNLLYIFALALGKLSTVSLLVALSPNKAHRFPMLVVGGFIAAWTFGSVLASAFQCSMPHPYLITTTTCINQVDLWEAVGVIDVLTDLALMSLPVWLVYNLQIATSKKFAVCIAFSFRTVSIACAIWRMTELHRFFDRNRDITFNSWLPTMATLLEVFGCIFAACVPHLRPFIDSIQAGYLSGVIQEGDGRLVYGNDSYLMGKMARSKSATVIVRTQELKSEIRSESPPPRPGGIATHRQTRSRGSLDLQGIGRALSSNHVVAGKKASTGDRAENNHKNSLDRHRSENLGSAGGRSHESDGSKAMIIKTTKEWSVSYHDV